MSVAVLVLGLAGCGSAPPTTQPTATSTATPMPVASARELSTAERPLEPGRYSRESFEPRITFEVADGWEAVQSLSGFFDVQQDVGSPDVIAVQFANVDGVVGADGGVAPASAADAAAALDENPGIGVLETSESRIGGLIGSQATIENTGDAHALVIEVPAGSLGIDPGRRLWVAFFDTEDGVLAVMVGGSRARWGQALAAAEPVLESVTIGD